jgi:murein DD-endopeptidase MepM/ murein hydrolase activator NlpD
VSSVTRRAATLLLCAMVVLTAFSGSASGSPFDAARQRRERLAQRITRERERARVFERFLERRVALLESLARSSPPRKIGVTAAQWRNARRVMLALRERTLARLRAQQAQSRRELADLGTRRGAVLAWIEHYGIFRLCPVRGPHIVNDDFGVVVRKEDVPTHVHLGNDITAATWTPVVAPFTGTAVAAPNPLGGLAVKVYGEAGYVYNAHFVAYGRLGPVHAGSVIGYVGSTGDAGGSHLHFEWHPNDGPAVDPHVYLMAVC